MEHFVPAGNQLSERCGGDGFVWGSAVGCRWWDRVVGRGGTMGLAAAAPLPSALGHGGARCDGSIDLSAVPRGWQEG